MTMILWSLITAIPARGPTTRIITAGAARARGFSKDTEGSSKLNLNLDSNKGATIKASHQSEKTKFNLEAGIDKEGETWFTKAKAKFGDMKVKGFLGLGERFSDLASLLQSECRVLKSPKISVRETNQRMVYKIPVPGIQPENITMHTTGKKLRVFEILNKETKQLVAEARLPEPMDGDKFHKEDFNFSFDLGVAIVVLINYKGQSVVLM